MFKSKGIEAWAHLSCQPLSNFKQCQTVTNTVTGFRDRQVLPVQVGLFVQTSNNKTPLIQSEQVQPLLLLLD